MPEIEDLSGRKLGEFVLRAQIARAMEGVAAALVRHAEATFDGASS